MRSIADDKVKDAAGFVLVSLLFAPGARPGAGDVAEFGRRSGAFSVSHQPEATEGWLELLVNGLTFDLRGLAPGGAVDRFDFVHRYALNGEPDPQTMEAVSLGLGPHLAGAETMMPVVRAAAGLAAVLAELPGCAAVGWRPARTLAGTDHFRQSVAAWRGGGAFPALGLTALTRSGDGSHRSEGLDFLIGRELFLLPSGASPAEDAKLALRLIDWLARWGASGDTITIEAMPGVSVAMTDDRAARIITAERVCGDKWADW